MQDSYVGDIGDFGKFVLLRRLEKEGFKIGINWYKTDLHGKSNDGKYVIPFFYEDSTEGEIAKLLRRLSDPEQVPRRLITELEKLNLIKSNLYYHDNVPQTKKERNNWYAASQRKLQDSTLVFLDPDNGLLVKSVNQYSKKSVKYVYAEEVVGYLENKNCNCVLFYNHRSRIKADQYFSEKQRQLENCMNNPYPIAHITFPRRTIRDYFAVCRDETTYTIIKSVFEDMIQSDWGPNRYELCRET